jgi:hypothetical protein
MYFVVGAAVYVNAALHIYADMCAMWTYACMHILLRMGYAEQKCQTGKITKRHNRNRKKQN